MLEEATESVLVYVPEKGQVRPRLFSRNSNIVNEITEAILKQYPKSEIDKDRIIDLGDDGKEVEFHKLSNADRSVGLYILSFLASRQWQSVEMVAVAELQGYTTHILHRMEKRTRTT